MSPATGIARAVRSEPGRVLGAVVAITVLLGYGLTRLEFRTSQDTLISSDSQVYADNVGDDRGDAKRASRGQRRAALSAPDRVSVTTKVREEVGAK
jgi:hypothetical protein